MDPVLPGIISRRYLRNYRNNIYGGADATAVEEKFYRFIVNSGNHICKYPRDVVCFLDM